VVVKANITLH